MGLELGINLGLPGMGSRSENLDLVCPAITPTLGPELLTDPGLEGGYTAGKADALSKGGTPNLTQSADAQEGTKAQQFVGTAGSDRISWASVVNPTAGEWYCGSVWGKRTAGSASGVAQGAFQNAARGLMPRISSATFVQDIATFRVENTNTIQVYAAIDYEAANHDTVIIDNASLRKITYSTTLRFLGTKPSRPGKYTCYPTIISNTQAGMAFCYKDENNHLLVRINLDATDNVVLEKRIAGAWAAVISGNINYGAGKKLEVEVAENGTDFSLYYDGLKIGATTAIADAGLGIGVFGFSSYAGNTVGRVTTRPFRVSWNVVLDGDSMTVRGDPTTAWPNYLARLIRNTYTNVATSGISLADMATRAAATVDGHLTAGYNVVCVWGGLNDMYASERAAADVYALLQTYCAARRAAGWEKTIVFTLTPATIGTVSPTYEARRQTLNALIRGGYAGFADVLIDVGGHAILGNPANCEDLAWYDDKLHISAAGREIVAGMVAPHVGYAA